MQEVKRVVIIGPESTGKSTLCKQLAAHYNTLWCPEYAREYLLEHGTTYTYENLLDVAKGQVALERDYIEKVKQQGVQIAQNSSTPLSNAEDKTLNKNLTRVLLFTDTDMYVMKVWCEFVFGKCHQFILDKIVERPANLYLLCNTDLPWIKDELREYPDLETREILYHIYKDIMINQQVPWVNIYGSEQDRVDVAIKAIDHHFLTATGV